MARAGWWGRPRLMPTGYARWRSGSVASPVLVMPATDRGGETGQTGSTVWPTRQRVGRHRGRRGKKAVESAAGASRCFAALRRAPRPGRSISEHHTFATACRFTVSQALPSARLALRRVGWRSATAFTFKAVGRWFEASRARHIDPTPTTASRNFCWAHRGRSGREARSSLKFLANALAGRILRLRGLYWHRIARACGG
jgi:hypothetical protein